MTPVSITSGAKREVEGRAGMAADVGINPTARAFVDARRRASSLDAYPGTPPADLASAYAIQADALRLVGERVGGWKVGRIWPPLDQAYGANRLAGPVLASAIGNGDAKVGQIFADGFGAAEAEFLFRLGEEIPTDIASLGLADIVELTAAVHVGIEIASSPFAGINEMGPAVTVSDFGNNNGLLVGPEIADWQASGFADWPVRLLIDGVEAGTGTAASFPDGPEGAVLFLLRNLAGRGIAITPGMWISTGAITGVHPVVAGQTVTALFGTTHRMECNIAAAQPAGSTCTA